MKQQFISESPADTERIGEQLADTLHGGEVIAFRGDLGMGKTCLVRGLARGLGYQGSVTSPTFALMNEYVGGRLQLYHFDMYRIDGLEDLLSTGYYDYLEAGGVLAVEWSERIDDYLEPDTVFLTIERTGDTSRRITVEREEQP